MQMATWHEHLIIRMHFPLWSREELCIYREELCIYVKQWTVFTGTAEHSSRSFTSHFRAKNGRVLCHCPLRTACDMDHAICYCLHFAMLMYCRPLPFHFKGISYYVVSCTIVLLLGCNNSNTKVGGGV